MLKAISQLNSNKSADDSGLTAEHLKNSGDTLINEITDIFNTILQEKCVPSQFKSGILTPVLKKSTLWSIVNDMYAGLTSKVKWAGGVSDSFAICQGVRQGGILSPFLYKSYRNPCLMELKHNRLGLCIGNIYCGCPTCAGDLAVLSDCQNELQLMANVIKRHAKKTE